jgi:maltose alpha-D-glucosyltransferase/alpha-amylase
LPLAFAWGDHVLGTHNANLPYVLAKIRRGARAGVLLGAAATEGFPKAVLQAMRDKRTLKVDGGEVRFEPGDALLNLEISADAPVQRTGEQSNTSVIVGNQANLKIYRHLHRGIEPEIEMGRFLSQSGFANSPPFLGSVEYVDSDGTLTALAVAFQQVRNQGDGWTVVVNALDRELEEASLASKVSDEAEIGIAYSLSLIDVIGRRTGEMHRALLQGGDEPGFAPEPIARADIKDWHDRTTARARDVFELLSRVRDTLGEEIRGMADRLLDASEAVFAKIDASVPKSASGKKMRLHNDLHLRQILVAENDIYIVDFGGEPGKSAAERREKAPPVRDVAGMLRSFDYAARNAIDRQKQRGAGQLAEVEARALNWRAAAEHTFLEAYKEAIAAGPGKSAHALPGRELLPLFLIDKLLYEIIYEGVNRPPWLSVPLQAMLELIEPMRARTEEKVE